jgi:hypothetical protein
MHTVTNTNIEDIMSGEESPKSSQISDIDNIDNLNRDINNTIILKKTKIKEKIDVLLPIPNNRKRTQKCDIFSRYVEPNKYIYMYMYIYVYIYI